MVPANGKNQQDQPCQGVLKISSRYSRRPGSRQRELTGTFSVGWHALTIERAWWAFSELMRDVGPRPRPEQGVPHRASNSWHFGPSTETIRRDASFSALHSFSQQGESVCEAYEQS